MESRKWSSCGEGAAQTEVGNSTTYPRLLERELDTKELGSLGVIKGQLLHKFNTTLGLGREDPLFFSWIDPQRFSNGA